ncbi:DUF4251 domain-containing protein [Gabonibacter massiliensis]|uniref:DUF4251 domain-containing protein n=1 Tax=Gabonibacter massiliensis TaxID=1720195 RepID=UPI00073E6D36|nr:DUF4251 domain-containing protein [Gabonibacter massiliensis]
MKNYLPFIFIAILLCSFPSISSGQKRSARFEAEFQKTFQIANSDRFMIRFFIATPTGQTFVATPSEGPNVTIDPEQCYLEIQDSLVSGRLPYFGNGSHWVPRPGQDSLRFNYILFSRTVKILPRGNKKSIAYQISILTKDNILFLHMDIRYDGTCYLYYNDQKRYPISYTGNIYPLEKKGQHPLNTASPSENQAKKI